MLPAMLALAIQSGPIVRDDFGVPHVRASNQEEAFFHAGYAVAQDRLWQMEQSRRLARGTMAAVFGAQFVASDREVLQTGYTDAELQAQLDRLAPKSRSAFREYARGVSAYIAAAKTKGLPPGYAQAGFQPEPWTELDSAAIAVRLLQQFGRGGAGEIRNMALLSYLRTQPKVKDRVIDVLDDLAWFNDSEATPTIDPKDDPQARTPFRFALPDRKATERHVAALPNVGLLELLPAVRLAQRETSTRIAEQIAAPFKTGSYAAVVGPSRSGTGRPLLLSAPQMGFRTPSIVHEISIAAPGLNVVGMNVPGIPGVLIGHTDRLAWGLTSGVADTDDIFFYPSAEDGYMVGSERRSFERISRPLRVQGGTEQTVEQLRTVDGPVVLNSRAAKTVFAKRASYWGRELESYDAVASLWSAPDAASVNRGMASATMSFNVFYATQGGEIGYRYVGLVPNRAPGVDPRFPTPGGAQYAWRGFVPAASMPSVVNPRSGVIANWNNKPAAWWPNFDTPVWGRIFRNSELLAALPNGKLNVQDLERAAWTIARRDETWPYFAPFVERWVRSAGAKAEPIAGYDGWALAGSRQAATFQLFLDALRQEIFLGTTGNFATLDNFRLVAQPTLMLRALQRRTRLNYLGNRTPDQVVAAAMEKAISGATDARRFRPTAISVQGGPTIPYANRGTYIQVIEFLTDGPSGRNVVTPGVAETGEHSSDQIPLARQWTYKAMRRPWLNPGQ